MPGSIMGASLGGPDAWVPPGHLGPPPGPLRLGARYRVRVHSLYPEGSGAAQAMEAVAHLGGEIGGAIGGWRWGGDGGDWGQWGVMGGCGGVPIQGWGGWGHSPEWGWGLGKWVLGGIWGGSEGSWGDLENLGCLGGIWGALRRSWGEPGGL